ncbi:hypothetical protein CK203_050853 [Vitis vinifera]|uniref:Uncharacterized protein n=1 Tax=Vitis vinifera TaxID=29760 RepID=A0A438HBN2_VITVI|nr:hypothetical protein CK203_050853 [Vitis vinifera]
MDLIRAGAKRCLDRSEMEELRNDAYINSKVAKQRMKRRNCKRSEGSPKPPLRNHLLAHECHFAAQCPHFAGCFATANTPLAHRVPFRSIIPSFPNCEMGYKMVPKRNQVRTTVHLLPHLSLSRARLWPSLSGPPWQEPEELSPHLRQAERNCKRDPCSRLHIRASATTSRPTSARVADSEPIDLTELSLEPSSELPAEPQSSQLPPTESHISLGMTPEELIRRPMVTQSPIEGNLECRARPFHSELCFDIATFRLQPELRDSFHLLHRGASSHQYLLRKELPLACSSLMHSCAINIYPLQHWVQRRGVLLEALFRISEGFFFGLIISLWPLFYTLKRRARSPSWSRTLGHSTTVRGATTSSDTTDTRPPAPTEPIPEVTPLLHLPQPQTPPVIPATSEPPTSSESRIAISISEYRGLCHTLQTLTTSQSILTQQMTALRAHQEQILATQTQHIAILRQIQHHLGIPSAAEHPIPVLQSHHRPSFCRPGYAS